MRKLIIFSMAVLIIGSMLTGCIRFKYDDATGTTVNSPSPSPDENLPQWQPIQESPTPVPDLSLISYDISTRSAKPGDNITFMYSIFNPAFVSKSVSLGATVKLGSKSYNNQSTNTATILAPGSNNVTFVFPIPQAAAPGGYDVSWEIWSGTPLTSELYSSANRTGYLSISVPLAPVLLSPANNTSVAGTSITFKWLASVGANNYGLAIIKPDGSKLFDAPVGNVTTYNVTGFLNNGSKYKWVVSARNSFGWSPLSLEGSFTN
jgi:hypothetical protein